MDSRTIIQQSIDYIENNLQTEITGAELAQQAGFSLFHYCRLFRQATGLSVMHYILRRRLLHGVYAMHRGSSTGIYYEGTGNKNESACYVGTNHVLKYTVSLGKLKKHIEVSQAKKAMTAWLMDKMDELKI